MTYKSKSLSKLDAANRMSDYAAKVSNYKEMAAFQNIYKEIYHQTSKADLFLDIHKILNTPSLEHLYS